MKFETYARRFRKMFNIPKDDRPSYREEMTWIYIDKDPLGSIILEWGNRVEGSMGLLAWWRERPVVAQGGEWALAPLVFTAESIGLSVDHPYLSAVKQRPEYQKMVEEKRVILEP